MSIDLILLVIAYITFGIEQLAFVIAMNILGIALPFGIGALEVGIEQVILGIEAIAFVIEQLILVIVLLSFAIE